MAVFVFTITPEQLAQRFQTIHERLAPTHPDQQALLTAVCAELLSELPMHTRPLTLDEAIEECRKWRPTDAEIEDMLG